MLGPGAGGSVEWGEPSAGARFMGVLVCWEGTQCWSPCIMGRAPCMVQTPITLAPALGPFYTIEGPQAPALVPFPPHRDPLTLYGAQGTQRSGQGQGVFVGPARGCSLFVNIQTNIPPGTHPLFRADRYQKGRFFTESFFLN